MPGGLKPLGETVSFKNVPFFIFICVCRGAKARQEMEDFMKKTGSFLLCLVFFVLCLGQAGFAQEAEHVNYYTDFSQFPESLGTDPNLSAAMFTTDRVTYQAGAAPVVAEGVWASFGTKCLLAPALHRLCGRGFSRFGRR